MHTKVFVGNLSFKTKAEELAAEFSAAGRVVSANIITRGPRSLGYGFVEMENVEDAQKAVQMLNKKLVDNREINVEIAKPREDKPPQERGDRRPREGRRGGGGRGGRGGGRGGRGGGFGGSPTGDNTSGGGSNNNAPQNTQSNNNNNNGGGSGAQDGRRNFQRNPRRFRRGGGADAGGGAGGAPQGQNSPTSGGGAAAGAGGGNGNGAPRRRGRFPRRDFTNRTPSPTTLFVANLPFSLDDEGLTKLFKDHKVSKAHVVKNRNGRSKGFGFVEFDQEVDQKAALEASNKLTADGRELIVKIALTAPETKDIKDAPTSPAAAAKEAQPAAKSDEKSS